MKRLAVLHAGLILITTVSAQQPGSNAPLAGDVPPAAPLPETIRSFNPLALNLAWNNRRWQLVDGTTILKDFGTREHEARQALRMIQEMGVNQYGTIGTPNPVMEYWLTSGMAPTTIPRGSLRLQAIDPGRLRVERLQGQWCVRDTARVLFAFGEQADDARLALAIMQKYRFFQVGSLGIGAPLMYVFFGRPDGNLPGLPASMKGNVSPGHLTTTPFSRVAKNNDGTPHIERPAQSEGLQGVAPAVLPPLASPPGGVQQTVPATLSGRTAPLWREQPHFGPRPTANVPANAERVPIDWRQVQMRLDGRDWKLTTGSLVLGNFGGNAQDARTALWALRYYRCTEEWHPGGDASLPHFYLASPQAPKGLMMGLNGLISFEPDKVEVRTTDGGYAVTDGTSVLLHVGPHKQSAQKLVEVIKQNKYDRLCRLGDPGNQAMTFFVRSK